LCIAVSAEDVAREQIRIHVGLIFLKPRASALVRATPREDTDDMKKRQRRLTRLKSRAQNWLELVASISRLNELNTGGRL
jgi:hypothetical protein